MPKARKKTKKTARPAILAIVGVLGFGYLVTLTTGFIDDYHRRQGVERIQADEQRLVRFVLEHHLASGPPGYGLPAPVTDDQVAAVAVDLAYQAADLPAEAAPPTSPSRAASAEKGSRRTAQAGSATAPAKERIAEIPLPPEVPAFDAASLPPEPTPVLRSALADAAPDSAEGPLGSARNVQIEPEAPVAAALPQPDPQDAGPLAAPTESASDSAQVPSGLRAETWSDPPAAKPVAPARQAPARVAAIDPPEAEATASLRAPGPVMRLLPPESPREASIDPGAQADRPGQGPKRALPARREPAAVTRLRAPKPAERRNASLPAARAGDDSPSSASGPSRRSTAALDTPSRRELPRSLRPRLAVEPASSSEPEPIALPAALRPTRIQPTDVVALRASPVGRLP